MKKILLLLLLGSSIHLNAATFEENKKDCNAGEAIACFNLGVKYSKGQVVKQD